MITSGRRTSRSLRRRRRRTRPAGTRVTGCTCGLRPRCCSCAGSTATLTLTLTRTLTLTLSLTLTLTVTLTLTLTLSRQHRDPAAAAKLYNNLLGAAWAKVPRPLVLKYGLKQDAVVYERHGARLLIDALQEAGQDAFAARLRDERKKALEQSKLKQARALP